MSSEIIAILIPTGILALVWVLFESTILKAFKKKGKSSDNKGGNETNLKKEGNIDSIGSKLKPEKKIVEPKLESAPQTESYIDEEKFYELAYDEIESGNLKKGLWAKAFSEAEGDEKKAKALYIKYRFDQKKDGQ